MTDKKILHSISVAIFIILLLALIIPLGFSGRVIGAILLVPATLVVCYFIKKRSTLSYNAKEVTAVMAVISAVGLMINYLSGLYFGFTASLYSLSFNGIFYHALPIAAIIVCSEIIRSVILASEDKASGVLCYISCVFGEMLVTSTIASISSFDDFMDMAAMTFFPSVIANFLYHYLVKRYGIYPNIIFRLVKALYLYFIPVKPNISDAIMAFVGMMLPIVVFLFIDSLYEKKVRYALQKKSKLTVPITVVAVAIMIFVITVVSNQFYIGTYVIATESMTGELNKGDAAIYERYDDQEIIVGQVIAFEKNDRVVIHRVADIQIINGQTRYFTKGDANEDMDSGFIYDSDIIGLINFKIPFIGYPTLWLRSLFSR